MQTTIIITGTIITVFGGLFLIARTRMNNIPLFDDICPVVIDFHALWCSSCKMQSPILKEVVTEPGDRIRMLSKKTVRWQNS
jgi:thiol-disulfide isomerase/thioredoxin